MSNVTRYSPFNDLWSRNGFLDNLFADISPNLLMSSAFERYQQPSIKLDVTEDDKAYTVHAEIPGMKKEDIKVNVDGNQVYISAEIKNESAEKKGERVLRSERYYGTAYRRFTLDNFVDETEVQARYDSGILTLILPKKKGQSTKQIQIR